MCEEPLTHFVVRPIALQNQLQLARNVVKEMRQAKYLLVLRYNLLYIRAIGRLATALGAICLHAYLQQRNRQEVKNQLSTVSHHRPHIILDSVV